MQNKYISIAKRYRGRGKVRKRYRYSALESIDGIDLYVKLKVKFTTTRGEGKGEVGGVVKLTTLN